MTKPLTAEEKRKRENYRSHKSRWSDSSLYDEVCTVCGARDYAIGPDELSERPCVKANGEP